MSSRPKNPQKCKYCKNPAVKSLIWADGRAYIPVCSQHETTARETVKDQNDSVCDVKMIDGIREDVNFGLIGAGQRKLSALSEAPPPKVAARQVGYSGSKVSNTRDAGSFLKALGTEWRQMRARRVHDHRISVDIDGAKFTLYTRNG